MGFQPNTQRNIVLFCLLTAIPKLITKPHLDSSNSNNCFYHVSVLKPYDAVSYENSIAA
jgi:hypothetical protein